jgi:hypothetical protein
MPSIQFGPRPVVPFTGKLAVHAPTIHVPAVSHAPRQPLPTDPVVLHRMGLTPQDAHDYNTGRIGDGEIAHRSTARLAARTHAKLLQANDYPRNVKTESMGAPIAPTDFVGRFAEDLANAGIGLPAGLYRTGVSVYHDAGALAHGHTPTHVYHDVLKPMAASFKESAEHPLRHPGFTFLNAWAVGSLGAGSLARAGAVREAIAGTAGEDAAAALRNLPRADRRARDVLLDPVSNFDAGDTGTLHRIAAPSHRLAQLLDKHPGMAEARRAVLQKAGIEAQAARERTPLETATEAARAAVRRPMPPQRTIRVGSEEVHPVASRNPLAARLQQLLDSNTEARLGHSGRQPDFLSAEAKVGKDLAAERAVREAKEQGVASRLERFGRTTKASVLRNAARKPLRGRLSAGEQKAVDIVASGLTPAEHYAYHVKAAQLARLGVKEYGDAGAHETQAALAQAAEAHLANPSEDLQEAIRLTRHAVQQREKILGLDQLEVAHRVGARAAEIKSLVEGTSSPHLRRAHLVEQLKEDLPEHPGPEVVGALHARLSQIEHETLAREQEVGARRARTDGILVNLRREASGIKTRIDGYMRRPELQLQLDLIDHEFVRHGQEAISRGGFYLPSKSLAPLRRPHGANVHPSEFGYRPPSGLPELHNAYTAALERSGQYRTDATGLAADAYRGAQRLASLQRGYEQVLRLAHNTREAAGGEQYAIPVRTTASIPKALREMVLRADRGELSERDLEAIHAGEANVADLVREFFPSDSVTPGPGIKYVDVRLVKRLAEQRALPSSLLRFFDSVNNVGRGSILYLKPAYIVNLLQNLGTATIEQGPFVFRNARQALTLGRRIGADDQHLIFSLVGEGHSRALDVGAGAAERAVHGAAEFWNAVTDRIPRVMAFLHEARAAGFDSPTALKALLHDPQFEQQLLQVTRRANREMVDYIGMTPLERNSIRRVFMFYPWLRGATIWSLRFPIEHPLQAATYGVLGRQGTEWEKKTLGKIPGYLEGVFPLMGFRPHYAHPFVTNPAALNTFETPIQIGQGLAGLAGPSAAEHAGDIGSMLTPALGAIAPLVSGQTSLGSPLPAGESRLAGAADELLNSAAPVSLAEKALQRDLVTGRKLKPGVTDKGPLAAARSAVLGSLGGTHLDLAKAHEQEAKAERAAMTPEQRTTTDAGSAIAAMPQQLARLKRQGINVEPASQKQVRDAIHFEAQRDLAYDAAAKQAGLSAQKLAPIDKLALTVQTLEAHGRLTPEQAQQWRAYYANTDDATISTATAKLWRDLGPGSVLRWWRGLVSRSASRRTAGHRS